MKIRIHSEHGMTLILSVIIVALVSFGLAGYVLIAQSNYQLQWRESAWKAALPLAELGVEEAFAHLDGSANLTDNGWVEDSVNGMYTKTREFPEGTVSMGITASTAPVIYATGIVQIARHPEPIKRVVRVVTTNDVSVVPRGIIARDWVGMNGNSGTIDSYDPTDPMRSTDGKYDPLKAGDDALVATAGKGSTNFFIGNKVIKGWAASPPEAPLQIGSNGSLGSHIWVFNPANAGKAEPARVVNAFSGNFDPVVIPQEPGFIPPSGSVNGVSYQYILDSGHYVLETDLSVGGKSPVLVRGNATLVVKGTLSVSSKGYIELDPSASLELYVAGDTSLSGNAILNNSQIPEKCNIYVASDKFKMEGSSTFYGHVYAPNAEAKLKGGGRFFGSVIAASLLVEGDMHVHVDRSGKVAKKRMIVSWEEL